MKFRYYRTIDPPGVYQNGEVVLTYFFHTEQFALDYLYDEVELFELFEMWVNRTKGKYENEMVPIFWSCHIEREDGTKSKPEYVPWQRNKWPEDFETHCQSEDPINWMACKVKNRTWSKNSRTHGFIQAATGWKPSPLQESVWLPALVRAARTQQVLV